MAVEFVGLGLVLLSSPIRNPESLERQEVLIKYRYIGLGGRHHVNDCGMKSSVNLPVLCSRNFAISNELW